MHHHALAVMHHCRYLKVLMHYYQPKPNILNGLHFQETYNIVKHTMDPIVF